MMAEMSRLTFGELVGNFCGGATLQPRPLEFWTFEFSPNSFSILLDMFPSSTGKQAEKRAPPTKNHQTASNNLLASSEKARSNKPTSSDFVARIRV